MKLRYFVVDRRGQLWKVTRRSVQSLWRGHRVNQQAYGGTEVRLVSVVCDDALLPQNVYLLRLPLTGGRVTRLDYLVLQAFGMPDCVTPAEAVRHHTEGWPPNFFEHLAVALDVPPASLSVPLGIGGPLFLAATKRVTPRQALRYLQ